MFSTGERTQGRERGMYDWGRHVLELKAIPWQFCIFALLLVGRVLFTFTVMPSGPPLQRSLGERDSFNVEENSKHVQIFELLAEDHADKRKSITRRIVRDKATTCCSTAPCCTVLRLCCVHPYPGERRAR